MIVKVVLGFAAFMVLSTCVGLLPSVVPDVGGDGGGGSEPVAVPGPTGTPTPDRPFRVVRDGRAPGAPAGWFRYVAGDGAFALIGPGRPDTDVTRGGGRYTFDAAPLTLTADVLSARGLGRPGRPRLERATAVFLDDLSAIEQGRRWSGFGDDVVLHMDARRGDDKLRIRTFSDGRRILRAYALWAGALAADEEAIVETFLAGLETDDPRR
jgi:hypothetical protein